MILAIRGTEEYRAALETLRERMGVANMTDMGVKMIEHFAKFHGVELPKRVETIGGDRKSEKYRSGDGSGAAF